jgi:hypothetical protein
VDKGEEGVCYVFCEVTFNLQGFVTPVDWLAPLHFGYVVQIEATSSTGCSHSCLGILDRNS